MIQMIPQDEITRRAAESYPHETEKTCKDKFARDLRNGTIDLMRIAFEQGAKWAIVELNKRG